MKIWLVPIEPVPNRYTVDWKQFFVNEFEKAKVEYEVIDGTQVPPKVAEGEVFDSTATTIYKATQLTSILNSIRDGQVADEDVIFFCDLWFPGIEALSYIRNLGNRKFKIVGILHAGSYDPYDFVSRTGMRNWAKHIEAGWLNAVDLVFVATQFHKDLLVINSDNFNQDKVFVTGIPYCMNEDKLKYRKPWNERENIVVFPHRISEEKQPKKFASLAKKLKKKHPDWKFVYTIEECNGDREKYFELLGKSKVMVSYALQETFGISTLEAMCMGCYVVVPDRLSYRETVPEQFRYTFDNDVNDIVESLMLCETGPDYKEIDEHLLDKWDNNSVSNMLQVLKVKIKEFERLRKQEEQEVQKLQKEKAEAKIAKEQERAEARKRGEEEALLAQEEVNARQTMGEGGDE